MYVCHVTQHFIWIANINFAKVILTMHFAKYYSYQYFILYSILFCWKKVADFLDYPMPKKKEIEERQHGDPTKCCVELLEDWLSTDSGVKPKTWSKLLSLLE